ncbi:hypothetical protein ACOSQ3_011027 [Xanthoceras sorbifolium]
MQPQQKQSVPSSLTSMKSFWNMLQAQKVPTLNLGILKSPTSTLWYEMWCTKNLDLESIFSTKRMPDRLLHPGEASTWRNDVCLPLVYKEAIRLRSHQSP